jgi:magnesium-protoporphyrin O-methyltransferase
LSGSYHTVICLDVLIHYPQDKAAQMIGHLASLADSRLILSFAPKTVALSLLKKIGSFFPGPSKATRAYLHREADVVKILENNGFCVQRSAMTRTRFYFSRILEATRR